MEAQGYGGGLPEKSPAERARHARGERLPPNAGQPPRGPHPLGSSSAAAEQLLLLRPRPVGCTGSAASSLGLRKTQRGAAYLRAFYGFAAASVDAATETDGGGGGGGAPARRGVGEGEGAEYSNVCFISPVCI